MYFNNDHVKIDHKIQNVTQSAVSFITKKSFAKWNISLNSMLAGISTLVHQDIPWYMTALVVQSSLHLFFALGKTFWMIFPMAGLLHVSTALQIVSNDNWFPRTGSIFSCSLQMKLSTSSTMAGTNKNLHVKLNQSQCQNMGCSDLLLHGSCWCTAQDASTLRMNILYFFSPKGGGVHPLCPP